MTKADTLSMSIPVNMSEPEEREDTQNFLRTMEPAAADPSVRQAKGSAPAARRKAPEPTPASAPDPARESAPEHTMTGQVRLDVPAQTAQPESGIEHTMTGQVRLDVSQPAGSTQDFDLDLELGPQVEEKPNTEQFVRGIAQTLNAGLDTSGETEESSDRFAEAAARLTAREPDDEAEQPRKKRGRMRFGGSPDDERDAPEAGGPFAAAEHRHKIDYETTEDAPKVRQGTGQAEPDHHHHRHCVGGGRPGHALPGHRRCGRPAHARGPQH